MKYRPTIGMEIHAELRTSTKMFCNSRNDAEETRANVNICPICLAHPGTLPVINKAAIWHVLRVGAALGGKLADYAEFDRKNYFYPDLPKGYQISQYEFPLVSGGSLAGVEITRLHLEEDTASSMHDEVTGETLIDFNRAGVPLMELVTEPVIHSGEEAGNFARELQLLLRYLGASEANMEKGEMRVEANISVSTSNELGTKVEVKNLNSYRTMERAVEYEIKRQIALLEKGQDVVQETRGWDEGKQETFVQRIKEGSADYRYFPDPDLPSLKLSELEGFNTETVSKTLPELPKDRRMRYAALGIKTEDADLFVRDTRFGDFFDAVSTNLAGDGKSIQLASNYIGNDLVKLIRDNEARDSETLNKIPIDEGKFIKIILFVAGGKISSRGAKDLLTAVFASEGDPEEIAKKKNLLLTDADMTPIVEQIIADNTKAVEEYKSGKTASIQFLVGQCMKALKGSGDPMALRQLLEEKLNK